MAMVGAMEVLLSLTLFVIILRAADNSTRQAHGAELTEIQDMAGFLFAHEVGHQFGMMHTFNGTGDSCTDAISEETAVEIGSGPPPSCRTMDSVRPTTMCPAMVKQIVTSTT